MRVDPISAAVDAATEIYPVSAGRWRDLVDLFERPGPRGGTPMTYNCWCMEWRGLTGDRDRNQQAMRDLAERGHEPGMLAYRDGEPVGWVSVGLRAGFAALLRSPTYRPVDDSEGVHVISCFYVHPSAKRQGVATALLDAAVHHAFERGAAVVEAYPGNPPDHKGRLEWFERRGFVAVRSAGKRTVMRYGPAM